MCKECSGWFEYPIDEPIVKDESIDSDPGLLDLLQHIRRPSEPLDYVPNIVVNAPLVIKLGSAAEAIADANEILERDMAEVEIRVFQGRDLIDPENMDVFLNTAHQLLAEADLELEAYRARDRRSLPPFDLDPGTVAGSLAATTV